MSGKHTAVAVVLTSFLLGCGSTETPRSSSEEAGAHLSKVVDALELVAQADEARVDSHFGVVESVAAGAPADALLELADLVGERAYYPEASTLDLVESHARGLRNQLETLGRLLGGATGGGHKLMMQVELPADAISR